MALLLAIESGRAGRIVEADTFETYAILRQTLVHPGRTRLILFHDEGVRQARWSRNETLILTTSSDLGRGGAVQVWDAETGDEILRLSHDGEVRQAR